MFFLIFFPVCTVDIFHRMVRLRKRLHYAVICDRDRRVSPFISPLDQPGSVRDAIHIAHLCVAVQFHPFHRAGVSPSDTEITALLDPQHRHNRQFPVERVHRRTPFQFQKDARFDRAGQFRHFFIFHENLHADRVGEICDREHEDRTFIADLSAVHVLNPSADHHISQLLFDPCDLNALLIEIAAVKDIRIRRTAASAVVVFPPPETAESPLASVEFFFPGSALDLLSGFFSVLRRGLPGLLSLFFRLVSICGRFRRFVVSLSQALPDLRMGKNAAHLFFHFPLRVF